MAASGKTPMSKAQAKAKAAAQAAKLVHDPTGMSAYMESQWGDEEVDNQQETGDNVNDDDDVIFHSNTTQNSYTFSSIKIYIYDIKTIRTIVFPYFITL